MPTATGAHRLTKRAVRRIMRMTDCGGDRVRPVSEYQYYEFQALDRPLSHASSLATVRNPTFW